jgi:hypothetical protein
VLSINICNGPWGTDSGWITGNVTARRLIVVYWLRVSRLLEFTGKFLKLWSFGSTA